MTTSNVQRSTSLLSALVLVILLGLHSFARGEQQNRLAAATQPLLDGVPEVAVVRLRALLAEQPADEERRAASANLVEALIASGAAPEALTLLNDPKVRALPGMTFQRAQALAAISRWAEALPFYQQSAAEMASPFQKEALYGQAESLRALGRIDEAIAVYRRAERDPGWTTRARLRAVELLIEKQDLTSAARLLDAVQPQNIAARKERRLLRGRVEAKRSRERAGTLYASILRTPEGAPHSVLVATLFALAEAHLQSHTPEKGDNFLEDFIERHPADPQLPAIFAKLDQLYAAQRTQSRHELGRWSNEPEQPRQAVAQWYLARADLRQGRRDLARESFERLRAHHPLLPELVPAFLEYAQLLLEEQEFDGALAILGVARGLSPAPTLRQQIDLMAGVVQYGAERFEEAGQSFRALARERGASPVALYNASIAWLQAGDAAHLDAATQELAQGDGDTQTRGDLLLERGLVEADRRGADAGKTLGNFLRDFPKHPRAAEAWVALAEMAFHAAPPRIDEARQNLARAAEFKPSAVASERADYLMIWLEDAGGPASEPSVIARASEFLQKYSASPLLADVRLKLAETYFRRQDFASAQTQFEILAQQNPTSLIAEKAVFFAAQSSAQSMGAEALDRALVLFDQVVKRNGELKWAARNEQAAIERKLGKPQDAVTLYDEVIASDASPAEKLEARCGKADVLFELGATDPGNFRRAIALYEEMAEEKDVSAHWRNQALFKKGVSLEKMEERDQALATFYRVIEDETRPEKQREYFWFYKAGFNAARLLEESSKWQQAAAVYEKLAFAGGARSEEAKARLNRVRLEHFLWEQ